MVLEVEFGSFSTIVLFTLLVGLASHQDSCYSLTLFSWTRSCSCHSFINSELVSRLYIIDFKVLRNDVVAIGLFSLLRYALGLSRLWWGSSLYWSFWPSPFRVCHPHSSSMMWWSESGIVPFPPIHCLREMFLQYRIEIVWERVAFINSRSDMLEVVDQPLVVVGQTFLYLLVKVQLLPAFAPLSHFYFKWLW